jgi:hypothetical protein
MTGAAFGPAAAFLASLDPAAYAPQTQTFEWQMTIPN